MKVKILILLFCVATIFAFLGRPPHQETSSRIKEDFVTAPPEFKKTFSKPEELQDSLKDCREKFFEKSEIKSPLLITEKMIENEIDDFKKDRSQFNFRLRNNNSTTVIANFYLVRSCIPSPENAIPDSILTKIELGEKTNRCDEISSLDGIAALSNLEKVAESGSTEAALLYVKNFDSIIKIAKFNKREIPSILEKEMYEKAEKLGRFASENGLEEAHWFMARAYLMGTFRRKDPKLAYLHTLRLQKSANDRELNDRLFEIAKDLTRSQIVDAEREAFSCQLQVPSNSMKLVSPF